MRKLLLCALLLTGAVAFTPVTTPPVQAQKKAKGTGSIEIGKGKDGKYRFFVRDGEGKLLAMSGPGGFASERDAKAAIEELKAVVARAKVTTLKPGK